MRFILTNDGSSNYMANALFDVTDTYLDSYTSIGMSYAAVDGCSMSIDSVTVCELVFDVIVAQNYQNFNSVESCDTSINYGGGSCTPDSVAESVYEAINSMRL